MIIGTVKYKGKSNNNFLERIIDLESGIATRVISNTRKKIDILTFARDYLDFYPDDIQCAILTDGSDQVLLNCTRQYSKSTLSSIKAYYKAKFFPGSLIAIIAPSLRQATELFRKIVDYRNKLKDEPKMKENTKLTMQLSNGSRIIALPSTQATIRGLSSASLIIEDEAAQTLDELYYSIRPMLAVSQGQLILMSTPFGERGHFHKEWTEGTDWSKYQVKATECDRISPKFLERERKALGDMWFRQEYMCEFLQTMDSAFDYDSINDSLSDDISPLFFNEN